MGGVRALHAASGSKRPHVTLRTDRGETYGLNGPAMDRWPSVVQLIPDKWRDPLVSDEALEYRTRPSRYMNDWLRQGLLAPSGAFPPASPHRRAGPARASARP